MNISQTKHEKPLVLGIWNATDDFNGKKGSGVKDLRIFAQAVDSTATTADFSKATEIGVIYNADNTPSYSKTSANANVLKTVLTLRNKDSEPIIASDVTDKIPAHSSNNIYPYNFDNYINGKLYYIWVLATDKAGWLEDLNADGTPNSKNKALYTTAVALDDVAPEFDGIVALNNVLVDASGVITMSLPDATSLAEANAYLKDYIVIFDQLVTGTTYKRTMYVSEVSAFDNTTKIATISSTSTVTSNVNATSGTIFRLPRPSIRGGIGFLELEYNKTDSTNLLGFRIDRAVDNVKTEPASSRNRQNATDDTYTEVGFINAEKFNDSALVLNQVVITDTDSTPNNYLPFKYLYRIVPISKWKDADGNYFEGQAIYSTAEALNVANYKPAKGNAPSAVPTLSTTSTNEGGITLSWDIATVNDDDGDLKGFQIERTRVINGTSEEAWQLIKDGKTAEFKTSGTVLSYIDTGLEPYNPGKIEYKYRIKSVDWASNSSAWAESAVTAATDQTAPLISNSHPVVVGMLGGWKGQITFDNGSTNANILSAKVWGRYGATSTDAKAADAVYVGEFFFEKSDNSDVSTEYMTTFQWNVEANEVKYAQFFYQLTDTYNNVTNQLITYPLKWYPLGTVRSETVDTVRDEFAPSLESYSIEPVLVPKPFAENSIKVASFISTTKFSITIDIDGAGTFQQLGANELVGKNALLNKNGETRKIINSSETGKKLDGTVGTADVIELEIESAYTASNPGSGNIVSISPSHVRVDVTVGTTPQKGVYTVSDEADWIPTEITDNNFPYALEEDELSGWTIDINGNGATQIVSHTARDINGVVKFTLKDAVATFPYNQVVDQAFTSNHDTAVSLFSGAIRNAIIRTTNGSTTYTENTDYTIDYVNGTITVLSTGSMADATSYIATYDNGSYEVRIADDLAGYSLYRSRVTSDAIEGWEFVAETKTAFKDDFSIVDRKLDVGTYKYGLTAHDMNGKESNPIKESTSVVTFTDLVAPGIPYVQEVIGGAGSLTLVWDRTADDIAYYKLSVTKSDDTPIVSGGITYTDKQIFGETHTIYGIMDNISSIEGYKYKVTAYDKYDNFINGEWKTSIPTHLDDYVPSDGTALDTPTSVYVKDDVDADGNPGADGVADGLDGEVTLIIGGAGLDKRTVLIEVLRQTRDLVTGSQSGFTYITTLKAPPQNIDGSFKNDVLFKEIIEDRVDVQYKVISVSSSGNVSPESAASVYKSVIDKEAPSVANITDSLEVITEIGSVTIKFKDIIDKDFAKYEIWRTSSADIDWVATPIYSNSVLQPFIVDSRWERIVTLSSTRDNADTVHDWMSYADRDWRANGTIDLQDTSLALAYSGKAQYCIIATDRWGNRSATPFLFPNVIYLPIMPEIARIEKGALYGNFNKGVQLNRGDVPINVPDAILHKGKGIEVLGDLKYQLDKFNKDYSVVVRRLERKLVDTQLTGVVDALVYNVSDDNVNYNGISFPAIALFVATATNVKLYEYESMTLIDTYAPTLTNGAITKIGFINGKLFVGTSSSVVAENYIKDYINGTVGVLHNSDVTAITLLTQQNTTYEIVGTNNDISVNNGSNTIRSSEKGAFTAIVVRNGYIFAYKDGLIYKSLSKLQTMDFSTDNAELTLFEIFMQVENEFKSLFENNEKLLIADSGGVKIIDDSDRTLTIGSVNTLLPFSGDGILCGIFEQFIGVALGTEDGLILATENNEGILL